MAVTTVENLEIHMKKTGSGGAQEIRDLAGALKELQQAKKGAKIPESLINSISELAGALKAINGEAISKMRQLAAALKTFDGLKGVKLDAKFASNMADIAAAADLVTDDHIQKINRFGDAIKNLGGAKNIGDKLADQLLDVAAAADLISDATITRIHRLTLALGRLKGVDLRGLGTVLSEQRKAAEVQARQVRQNKKQDAGGQTTTKTERQQIQWTWNLKKNVQNIGKAWISNVHPAVKVVASVIGGIAKVLGKIVKLVANIAKGILKWAFHTAVNALKKIWQLMQWIAKMAVKVNVSLIKGMAKYVTEVGRGVANISKNIARFAWEHSPVKKLTESFAHLKKTLSSFGRVAFYRMIRSAIKYVTDSLKEGSENAYFFSKEFGDATAYISEQLDILSTANFKMKNQVGAAWSTLLATIEPILLRLLELVTKAGQIVTQFFGAMGGKSTYLKAKSYPQEWAEDAEEAAEKTAEWKNQLMDFDTLNRLNEQNDSKSDATDKIKDYAEMFEEVPIDPWITELTDLLKLKNLLDELGGEKYYTVGLKMAEGLNDLLKKLDDWIVNITPKLKIAAGNLAELFNGLIDGTDWELLGKTIGDGLNAIFGAIDEFLTSVRWKDLGRGLGTAIKSMLDTVDWNLVGKTFADAWNAFMYVIEGIVTTPGIWKSIGTSLGQLVKGWVDNIDIDSMATSVIAIMNGVAEAIENFLAQNPFENLASKLTNAIERIIKEVKWGYIGEQFGKLFQTILDVINDVIFGTDWKAFGTAIGTAIRNFLAEIDFKELGETLVGVITSALDFVYGVITTPGFMAQLATSLHDFFIGALGQFEEWLNGIEPTEIANAIREFFDKLKPDEIKDAYVRVVKLAWEKAMAVKENLFPDGLLVTVTNHLVEYFNSLEWEKLKTTITENVQKVFSSAMAVFDAIWPPDERQKFLDQGVEKIKEIGTKVGNALWEGFKESTVGQKVTRAMEIWHAIKTGLFVDAKQGFEELYQLFHDTGENSGTSIVNGFSGTSGKFEEALDNTVSKPAETKMTWLAGMLQGSGRSAAYSLAQSIVDEQGTVNTAMDNSFVKTAGSAVQAFLQNIGLIKPSYEAEASAWEQISGQVKDTVVGNYDTLGEKVPQAMGSMQTNLDTILSKIGELFGTMRDTGATAVENMSERVGTAFGGVRDTTTDIAGKIGQAMTDMMSKAAEKLGLSSTDFSENLKSIVKAAKSALGIEGDTSTDFMKMGQYVMTGFLKGLVDNFKDITGFFTDMVTAFSGVGEGLVSALQSGFNSLWGGFSSSVSELVGLLVNGISTTVQNGFSGLGTAIGSAVTTATGKLNELADAARTNINTLIDNSKTTLNNIVSSISTAVNGIINQANAILSKIRGRSYATGGFPEDGVFFANHHELVGQFSNGKTAVANNEQIIDGIEAGVARGMARVLGGSSNDDNGQPINVYIGDELVYSGYSKWNKRQQLLSGGRA